MADTTIEEARRCPKCEEPGAEVSNVGQRGGGRLMSFICKNSRCRWYNTPWLVSIRPDGTIPDPTEQRLKNFPRIPDRTDQVQEQMARLYNQTLAGGEINN